MYLEKEKCRHGFENLRWNGGATGYGKRLWRRQLKASMSLLVSEPKAIWRLKGSYVIINRGIKSVQY